MKSGSVTLTVELFVNRLDCKSIIKPIEFKSDNSGAQFGATLERFAADITPANKKSAAVFPRSRAKSTLKENEENEFEVEKILQRKDGQYLVK